MLSVADAFVSIFSHALCFGDLSMLLILLVVCTFTLIILCVGVWQNDYSFFCKWVFRSCLVLAVHSTPWILSSIFPSCYIYSCLGYSIKGRFASSHAMNSDIFFYSAFFHIPRYIKDTLLSFTLVQK